VNLSTANLVMGSHQSTVVWVNVTVPAGTPPNTMNTIEIRAYFREQDRAEYAEIRTGAKQRFEVEIVSLTDELHNPLTNDSMRPGETHTYLLTVRNAGNGQDNLSFSMNLPDGWNAEFFPSVVREMGVNETAQVLVNLTSSPDAIAYSNHTLNITAFSLNSTDTRYTTALHVSIVRVRGVNLTLSESMLSILPEQNLSLNFTLRNTGNWYENFTLNLTGLPLNYTILMPELSVFGPDEERNLTLFLLAPGPLDPQARAHLTLLLNLSALIPDAGKINWKDIAIEVSQLFLSNLSDSLQGTIKPGEVRVVPVRLTNPGNGRDVFRVSAYLMEREWNISLINGTEEVKEFVIALEPGEYHDFALVLRAPDVGSPEAVAGYTSTSALIARSLVGNTMVYRFANTTVEQVYSVVLSVDMNNLRILPGETVNYTLTINNTGNGQDTIYLDISSIPAHWDVALTGRSITLNSLETTTRTLTITAPDEQYNPGFGDTASIVVKVTPHNGTAAGSAENLTVNTTISFIMPVHLQSRVTPGEEKVVPFRVMNIENSGRTLYVTVDTVHPFRAEFPDGSTTISIALYGHQRTIINVTVTPPHVNESLAWESAPLYFNLTQPREDSVCTELIVNPVYNFTLTPVKESLSGDPGASLNFSLLVNNTGNAQDIYRFTVDIPSDDWSAEFYDVIKVSEGGKTNYLLGLEPGASAIIHLNVTIPENERAGSHAMGVFASSDHGKYGQTQVKAEVNAVYGVALTLQNTRFNAVDGETLRINLEVKNTGNAQDNITMSLSGVPQDWSGFYSTSFFTLPAGTSKPLTLTLNIPLGTTTGDRMLNLTATSQGGAADYREIKVSVSLQPLPDLTVSSILVSPDSPVDGEFVQITATITNVGNRDASNVVVRFMVDGKLITEKVAISVPTGRAEQVSTEWESKKGTHTLKVIVDPTNSVNERNEGNNEATKSITVSEKTAGRNWGGIIFIALLAIGGVVVYRFRLWERLPSRSGEGRKKRPEGEEEIDFTEEREKALEKRKKRVAEEKEKEKETPLDSGKKKPAPKITLEEEIFPVILRCPKCKSKIRIMKPGKFRCPNCHYIGRVDETGELVKSAGPKVMADTEQESPAEKEEKAKAEKGKVSTHIRPEDEIFPMKYPCPDCGKKSTVGKVGWYKCPFCGSVHYIGEDGEIDSLPEEEEEKEEDDQRESTESAPSLLDKWIKEAGETENESAGKKETPEKAEEEREGEEKEATQQEALAPEDVKRFPAVVACPSCGTPVRVRSEGTYQCPECGSRFMVGTPKTITSKCPWCGVTVRVKGPGKYNCPSCSRSLTIEEDGSSGIELDRIPEDLSEIMDSTLSAHALYLLLREAVPEITEKEAETLHGAGYRTVKSLKEAEAIDLALAGIDSDKADRIREWAAGI